MDDDSGFVRGGAAWALGNIGDKRAIEPLKKALNDESSYVKRVAEKFLKKLE
jgi:PBS lyase HEAT-like repeat.